MYWFPRPIGTSHASLESRDRRKPDRGYRLYQDEGPSPGKDTSSTNSPVKAGINCTGIRSKRRGSIYSLVVRYIRIVKRIKQR